MGLKKYKPMTAGIRFRIDLTKEDITCERPEKSLIEPLKKTGGRNSRGRITAYHRISLPWAKESGMAILLVLRFLQKRRHTGSKKNRFYTANLIRTIRWVFLLPGR